MIGQVKPFFKAIKIIAGLLDYRRPAIIAG
jgi:hypothetical protein